MIPQMSDDVFLKLFGRSFEDFQCTEAVLVLKQGEIALLKCTVYASGNYCDKPYTLCAKDDKTDT